jgi:hypothetical protein
LEDEEARHRTPRVAHARWRRRAPAGAGPLALPSLSTAPHAPPDS